MNIFANISEPFIKKGELYVSKYVAGKFLQKISNVRIASPVVKNDETIINTFVESSSFAVLPEFSSAFDFIKNYIFYSDYRKIFNTVITKEVASSDKVWVRAPSIDSVLVARIALGMNKPVIMHIAGDLNGVWKNKKYSKLKAISAYLVAKLILILVSRLASNNNVYILSTGNDLNNRYAHAANGSKLFFDTCLDIPKAENSRELNSDVVKLLYVGRLESDKGVLTLCEMVRKSNLHFKDKKIKLTVIGFGTAKDELRRQICESELDDVIDLIGFVKNDELSDIYLSHDVFVFPSTAPEGFPRVIQEAWLHGLPVVTSDTGGITGVAVDGVNAVVFEAGNTDEMLVKLLHLLSNEDLLEELRTNIMNSRQEYTATYQKNIALTRINEAVYSG